VAAFCALFTALVGIFTESTTKGAPSSSSWRTMLVLPWAEASLSLPANSASLPLNITAKLVTCKFHRKTQKSFSQSFLFLDSHLIQICHLLSLAFHSMIICNPTPWFISSFSESDSFPLLAPDLVGLHILINQLSTVVKLCAVNHLHDGNIAVSHPDCQLGVQSGHRWAILRYHWLWSPNSRVIYFRLNPGYAIHFFPFQFWVTILICLMWS